MWRLSTQEKSLPLSRIGRTSQRLLGAISWTLQLTSLVLWFGAQACIAQSLDNNVDFSRQIRPILAKHCFHCHGPQTQESGLALHEFDKATRRTESGHRAIVPKDIHSSELVRRITSKDPDERMPPEGSGLSETQMELIKSWIASGAEYKEHWAFLPLTNPKPPQLADGFREANPIDRFIRAKYSEKQLVAANRSDPIRLIRRLYFDCIGVPPDLATAEQFAANPTREAYERIVDELLADPRFGERQARNWLDLVRYAETNSYERDGAKPNAWKYRDYVIDSMNRDKPYSQFLLEQLAGDELADASAESLTATGFFRLGIWDDEPADPEKARYDELDDMVTTIGQGMLGLTMNCARCHDHKIDPITQKDYYQLVAFLRDVTSYGARGDEKTNSQIDVSSADISKQNNELKEKIKQLKSTMRRIEDAGIAKLNAEDKKASKGPDRNKVIQERLQQSVSSEEWQEYEAAKKQIDEATKAIEKLPIDFRLGLAKCDPTPDPTFVLMRGTPGAHSEPVEPDFPKLFQEKKPTAFVATSRSAGRRIELARWMVSSTNRLTSRVIVNRLWQHHFGRGIVRSTNNFGQLGDPPTHPELLDFLAQQLIRFDWQLKPLHRMMLLSETYQLSSIGDAVSNEKDPANDYFARFNVRRLSAEELRDAILSVNGRIHWKQHGPSIFPDVSDDVKAGQSVPGKGWGKSSDAEKARRSIYIHIKRSLIPPELSVFDFPETDTSCEARFLTTQAAQALNMLNGAFLQQQSAILAELVSRSDESLSAKVTKVIERAYSRPAQTAEIERAIRRINSIQANHGLDEQKALRQYCLVLLNSNEFLYLD